MTDLTITIPPRLSAWVESRLASGDFTDAGDYLRELVRRDQAAATADRRLLRVMIDEGLASGTVEGGLGAVMDELLAADQGPHG